MRGLNSYRVVFASIFLLWAITALTQSFKLYTVSGKVVDAESKRSLPSANISLIGLNLGTITNQRGEFSLVLPAGQFKLVFQYLGYRSDTLVIQPQNFQKPLTIALEPEALVLPPVEIVESRFNPAEEVILKAIQHKQQFWKRLKNYQFQAYTRTVIRAPTRKNNCSDTSIVAITETQVVGEFIAPDNYREIITARKQSRNVNPTFNIFTAGRIPNLNDDEVIFNSSRIISPTHPRALSYYHFQMVDTLNHERLPIYMIHFYPRTNLVPLFSGTLWIIDSLFQVVSMEVSPNPAVDTAPLFDMSIEGQFSCFSDSFYLPKSVIIRARMSLGIPGFPPLFLEQSSVLYDYKINSPDLSLPSNFNSLIISDSADVRDDQYWATRQRIPLTVEEQRAYHEIDSIVSRRKSAQVVLFLSNLTVKSVGKNITSFWDIYHFNRVEGHYLGIGLKGNSFSPAIRWQMKGGYGFADRNWKYELRIGRIMFQKNRWQWETEVDIHKHIEPFSVEHPFGIGEVTYFSLMNKNDYYDYFQNQAIAWKNQLSISAASRFKVRLGYEDHRSVFRNTNFSLFNRNKRYRENPSILNGKYIATDFGFQFDNRRFAELGSLKVTILDRNFWVVKLQGEYYTPLSKNLSDFWLGQVTVLHHHTTFWGGFVQAQIAYGMGENLPLHKQFTLFPPYEGYSKFGCFKSTGFTFERGQRIFAFFGEHHFGNWPVRWIPLANETIQDLLIFSNVGYLDSQLKVWEAGLALNRVLAFFRLNLTLLTQAKRNFSISLEWSF